MGINSDIIRKLESVDPVVKDVFLYLIDDIEKESALITIGRSDFNELKGVVLQLAEAQNRTEKRVEELAEAQKRTEKRVEELAEAQKRTETSLNALAVTVKDLQVQVGGLSMAVGYGIEDNMMPHLKRFALREHGLGVTLIDRRNIFYPDGKYDEINLYVEGIKDGHSIFMIGECKAQPGKKDFDRFDKMLTRLRDVLKGDIIPFMVGYHYAPDVESYAIKEYPHILRYKTFQISNHD